MRKRTLSYAVSAILLAAAFPAAAQQQVPADGHALDANNRIGSGGRNDNTSSYIPPNTYGNKVVTNNVTDFRGFRGTINYTDPLEFRGRLPSVPSDILVRNGSGGYSDFSTLSVPFYGHALATTPPPGYVQNLGSGTFTRVAPLNTPPNDARLNKPYDPNWGFELQPGESNLAGPLDLTGGPRTSYFGPATYTSPEALDATARIQLDGATLNLLRRELNDAAEKDDQRVDRTTVQPLNKVFPQPGKAGENTVNPNDLAKNPNDKNANPGDLARDPRISGEPLANVVQRDGGMTQVQILVPAAEQSKQYSELQKALEKYYADRLKDDSRYANDVTKLKQQSATTRPTRVAFDYGRIARELVANDAGKKPGADVSRPAPLAISSFADGMEAKGLAGLMKKAEDLMTQGKYTSALEVYDQAGQVAPNNPLVRMGRAVAELGAGYYAKADRDIRIAFGQHQPLLLAQFDLRKLIGEERLGVLVKDLKQLATTEKDQPRHMFLLAFIAYNTGNEKQAGQFLDLAQDRSGGYDVLIRTIKEHWRLESGPATQPAR